jgi:hypothetical protein
MATTYEKIATTTLGSAAASITFSSIAATYTDLRLVLVGTSSAGGGVRLQFNSDTATNYSNTQLYGFPASAYSGRETNKTYCDLSVFGFETTIPCFISTDIFSYAGSTYKTLLAEYSGDQNGSGGVARVVNLWRSTSAITSMQLSLSSGNYNTGTTATLYGILKA